MRREFPFASFLRSLESQGFHISLRDYKRIGFVLQADRQWTIENLKATLSALLTSDPRQEMLFSQSFDEFFSVKKSEAKAQRMLSKKEIEHFIEDLQELTDDLIPLSKVQESEIEGALEELEVEFQDPKKLSKIQLVSFRYSAIGMLFIISVLLIIWLIKFSRSNKPTVVPPIGNKPTVVPIDPNRPSSDLQINLKPNIVTTSPHFRFEQEIGLSSMKEITVNNQGDEPVIIDNIRLAESNQNYLTIIDNHNCTGELSNGKSCNISFTVSSMESGAYENELIIEGDAKNILGKIPITVESVFMSEPQKIEGISLVILIFIFYNVTLLSLLYGPYLWRQFVRVKPPPYDPNKPSHFRIGKIGGRPKPWLDHGTLDQLALALDYFQSEEQSRTLDVDRSIDSTLRNAGLPALIYKQQKQVKQLLILENETAKALNWNTIPKELVEGLQQRGISVRYGKFRYSLQRFYMDDGTMLNFSDLEEQRKKLILLIFSDTQGLKRYRDKPVLQSLSQWPIAVWMELREPRFWDRQTAFVAQCGLPVFPATRKGLLQVWMVF